MNAKTSLTVVLFSLLSIQFLLSQNLNDYRSTGSGNWTELSTWQVYIGDSWQIPAQVPHALIANQITILAGHSVTVNANTAVDQMVVELGGNLILGHNRSLSVDDGEGDDLVIDGSLFINGDSNQNSIGITGSGRLVINGTCYWDSGGITNSNFHIAEGGTMQLSGSGAKIMRAGARIYNHGTVICQASSGTFIGVGNSIFDNLEGAIFQVLGEFNIRYEYAFDWSNQYTFNNYGQIQKLGADSNLSFYRGSFNNYGSIAVAQGNLRLHGSGTHSSAGQIDLALDTSLRVIESAVLNLNAGASFEGMGSLVLQQSNSSTVMRVNSADPPITTGADVIIRHLAGTIEGGGRLNLGGEFIWSGGNIQGPVIEIGEAAVFSFVAGTEKRLTGGGIDNYGQLLHQCDEYLSSNNGAVINNFSGALLDLQSLGGILYRSDLGGTKTILNNYGELLKSGDPGTSTLNRINFNHHPGATCLVQEGTLQLWSYGGGTNYSDVQLSSGCSFVVASNFEWTLAENSSISGEGTVQLSSATLLATGTQNGAEIGSGIYFEMLSGRIGGAGKLYLRGDMLWSGGELNPSGFIIAEGVTVTATGASADLRLSGTGYLQNYGHLMIQAAVGSGNINLVNNDAAIFELGDGSGFWHTGGGAGPSTLTNHGIIRKSGESYCSLYRVNTVNYGLVEVQEGSLRFELSTFSNQNQVDILEGAFILHSSITASGEGNFFVAEGARMELTNSYTLNCQDGAQIDGSGELRLSGGSLNSTGTDSGLQIEDSILIRQVGGGLGGSGKIYFDGLHIWTAGNCFVGDYYLGENGEVQISSTDTKRLGNGNFHNNGLVKMSGSLGGGNLQLYNYEGAELWIEGQLDIWHTGGGSAYPYLHNYGLLRKTGPEAAYCNVLYLKNYSEISVEGIISFYCSGSAVYNQAGSNASYHLSGRLILRYGNISINNVHFILDGSEAQIWDHNSNNLLASCTGTSASGSFTLLGGANLSTNGNFNNAGLLDLGQGLLLGNGNFTSAANSHLIIGSPEGICLSGEQGNIQKSGTRSYSTAAHYTYRSLEAQVGGDGLPPEIGSLTLDSPSGMSLQNPLSISDMLMLRTGVLSCPSLSLGGLAAPFILEQEDGWVAGEISRWIGVGETELLFPAGTQQYPRPLDISFASPVTVGGYLSLQTVQGYPGNLGLPLDDAGTMLTNIGAESYWRLEADDSLEAGTYSISILANGFAGISDYTSLHLVSRADAQSPWLADGLHQICTGTNIAPLISRLGLLSFGDFSLASIPPNFPYLPAVQNLQVQFSGSELSISWEPVAGATGYKVYASDNPMVSFPEYWVLMADLPPTTLWIDPSAPGNRRFYIVTAEE